MFSLRLRWRDLRNDLENDRNVYSTSPQDHSSKLLSFMIIKLPQKDIPAYLTNLFIQLLKSICLNWHWRSFLKSLVLLIVQCWINWYMSWLFGTNDDLCCCVIIKHNNSVIMCYYKGNIQDLLVIPVLSSTINHQTPSGSIFHLILFCQIMLRNIWNHNIFEVYHFKRAYLLLWVLSTISFKARIWDFLRNENAPHQMLFSKVVHRADLNFFVY